MRPERLIVSLLRLAPVALTPIAVAANFPGGIYVAASDNVLESGRTTSVNVFAAFPDTAFAFAAAGFDVTASIPAWNDVSGGLIVGPNVSRIAAAQPHNPNDPADPTNPLPIWSATFSPKHLAPLLVEIATVPRAFSYYPSEGADSSVRCAAAPGRDWLLVNPLDSGGALLAPAPGTSMAGAGLDILIANTADDRLFGSAGRDVLIGGAGNDTLLGSSGDDFAGLRFGLLAPEGQPFRIVQDAPLSGLTIAAEVERAAPENDDCPTEIVELAYAKAPHRPMYAMSLAAPSADEVELNLNAFAGQTVRIRFQAADASAAMLDVVRIPDEYSFRVEPDPRNGLTRVIAQLEYDSPVQVLLSDGSVRTIRSIEVHSIQHSLRDLGIGVQRIGLLGAGKATIRDLTCTVKTAK